MALSKVHNLEISTAGTRCVWSIFSRKHTSILPRSGGIRESIHSQTDGPSSGKSGKFLSKGGNWSTWSILAVSNSTYFGSIMRVLVAFPGSIYSRYSGYCKVFRMFVQRVLLMYSGFCIPLIMFPTLEVFGPSVLLLLTALAALI